MQMGPTGAGGGELGRISNRTNDQETKNLIAIITQLRTDHMALELRVKELESQIAELRRS